MVLVSVLREQVGNAGRIMLETKGHQIQRGKKLAMNPCKVQKGGRYRPEMWVGK